MDKNELNKRYMKTVKSVFLSNEVHKMAKIESAKQGKNLKTFIEDCIKRCFFVV